MWSSLTGKLGGIVPNFAPKAEPDGSAPSRKRAVPNLSPDMLAPLPPERPAQLETAVLEAPTDAPSQPPEPGAIPLPPPRPKILVAYAPSLPPIPFMQTIEGSQPILPARFVPFPKNAT